MAKILIPESLGKNVRAAARALTRTGDICDLAWDHVRIKSRYFRHFHKITSSFNDDRAYIYDIINLCKEQGYGLIMPFGNTSYYAVSKHGSLLKNHNIKYMAPEFEKFCLPHDKYRMTKFCEQIGIGVPQLFSDYDDNDIHEISNNLKYPVVIKAKSGVGVATGLRYANNKQELLKYYNEISAQEVNTGAFNYDQPMIQEFIPGVIHDACSLTVEGRVMALLTQIRQIMYPIYGGVGAVNVTTKNPELSELARYLLETLGWHGPAQIEFKYDIRDKRYKLIEMNPKLWGTLDLSIRAGINFVELIKNVLVGKDIKFNNDYKNNIRYVFMFPNAFLSYLEMIKEFGFVRWKKKSTYAKIYSDIDLRDPLAELPYIYSTLRHIMTRQFLAKSIANLSKGLVLSGIDKEII